jgi:prepilin-type N-terminal cleavage/methylation domain-containing protein
MLARIRKAMEEREGGFTLIELLVVIIIIGILAAIAIPVFLNQRKKGYEASMKSDLRTVANEMETYFTDNQVYPTAAGSVSVTVGTGGNAAKMSSGNTVATLAAGNNGFCLKMTSSKTTALWYYDSLNGGVTNTACPTAGTTY